MTDDEATGTAVDEPLLLILLGERSAAARLEAEWRQAARTVLPILVHREVAAAPAELLALAKELKGGSVGDKS
jgi:hypothetical protein